MVVVETENETECPEHCDKGILKPCASEAGYPCPVCNEGRVQLQKAFEEHWRHGQLQTQLL